MFDFSYKLIICYLILSLSSAQKVKFKQIYIEQYYMFIFYDFVIHLQIFFVYINKKIPSLYRKCKIQVLLDCVMK